jgi:hypothetical protein
MIYQLHLQKKSLQYTLVVTFRFLTSSEMLRIQFLDTIVIFLQLKFKRNESYKTELWSFAHHQVLYT